MPGDDLFVIELAFLEDFVIAGEDGEVATAGTPGGVIGGDGFFGEFLSWRFGERVRWRGSQCVGAHKEMINLEARKPERGIDESGR